MNEAIAYLAKKDKTLQFIVEKFGVPAFQKRQPGFAALCHIILEQQVSIESAKATYVKMELFFGEINPIKIATATADELRKCGLSRQKISYLKDLAEKVLNKLIDFESFKFKSEAEIRAELITIKGVGNWTIEVYLMFCLQLEDVIPLGDIAIKNTISELYQVTTFEEVKTLSDTWQPHRTSASYLLWHYYLVKRGRI